MGELVSVEDILKKHYRMSLEDTVRKYFTMTMEELRKRDLEFRFVNEGVEWHIGKASIVKVSAPFLQPINDTRIDYYIEGDVWPSIMRGQKEVTPEKPDKWTFLVEASMDLRPCELRIIQLAARVVDGLPSEKTGRRTAEDIQMSDKLLPIMYEGDSDLVASKLLDIFFPEAKLYGTPVDADLIAERMKLHLVEKKVFGNYHDEGLFYFDSEDIQVEEDDGTVHTIIVNPCTIVINRNLINENLKHWRLVRKSTIMHECIHMFKDKYFFLLQHMNGGRPMVKYAARRKSRYRHRNTEIGWMELQAEKMTAAVLMEKGLAMKAIKDQLDLHQGDRGPRYTSTTVSYLASKFQVSLSMARYRMVELGYPEAEGVFAYVDGERVPDYGCAGDWKKGLTYTIPRKDVLCLLEDPAFRKAFQSGAYIYLEHHIVLDLPEYVQVNSQGKKRLTDYARTHIDECCLAFTVSGRYADGQYREGAAARGPLVTNEDEYPTRYIFQSEEGSAARVKEAMEALKLAKKWAEIKRNLPDDFREAVKYLIDVLDTTQEEIAFRLGIGQPAFSSGIGRAIIPLNNIVGICIAMELPYMISEVLIRLGGCSLRNKETDHLYEFMLGQSGSITVEDCNNMLADLHKPPLWGKDDNK